MVYPTEKSIDSQFIKDSVNDFITKQSFDKPCVIVWGNGPIHHAQNVKNEFFTWESLDLFIFYLPNYSPHLNPIEILWRFCKYHWFQKSCYRIWNVLKKHIIQIFKNYGSVYSINFKELILKNTINKMPTNFA